MKLCIELLLFSNTFNQVKHGKLCEKIHLNIKHLMQFSGEQAWLSMLIKFCTVRFQFFKVKKIHRKLNLKKISHFLVIELMTYLVTALRH